MNRINVGPPYHVERIQYGPQYRSIRQSPPQVCDHLGTVAVSGPGGAVFCASDEQAQALCEAANAGQLPQQ